MDEVWAFEHSIECLVTAEFAWRFWTDVNNWRLDADIESVELNGPFAAGSAGATITRSMGRIEWRIVEVQEKTGALLETPVRSSRMQFRWKFEDLGERTRITQRISIGGDEAVSLVNEIAPMMERGAPGGMQKLCQVMAAPGDSMRRRGRRHDLAKLLHPAGSAALHHRRNLIHQ